MTSSQLKQAWATSLKLLGISTKSRRDLARKLDDRGYESEVVEKVLVELESKGILSDREFARQLVNRYTIEKPSGRRRIDFELKKRGIPEEIREEAIESIQLDEELEGAVGLGSRRWDRIRHLEPMQRKKRLFDLLSRRGFSYEICQEVLLNLERKHESDFENDDG